MFSDCGSFGKETHIVTIKNSLWRTFGSLPVRRYSVAVLHHAVSEVENNDDDDDADDAGGIISIITRFALTRHFSFCHIWNVLLIKIGYNFNLEM